ncbi:hypothetical protein AJ79_02331 [Helicocarpus griseus UAMH5409]|uniref:Trafficking protein particle complex II-specific subunit 65 IgD3 domain-containing protein n=1 Tax=Helicocarpus griseus UAMH5409 TaxID=1447875 RepID=A0A2B7Y338_9EURO|nr:hypothetical protein AJ79_02331 [Helicocarpus griseus UAMH5409]
MAPEEFLHRAVLGTIVPYASDVNLEEALNSSAQDEELDDTPSLLPTIRQRSLLFFDELLPVYVVLRLTNCSENALKTQLPRLTVQLDAFAANGVDVEEGEDEVAQQTRDLIYSGTVGDNEDPLVVVNEVEDDEDVVNHVFVIWKLDTFLNRPRVRLQHPSVVFTASATLSPLKISSGEYEDDYLPSGIPGSVNVFQSLTGGAYEQHSNPLPFLPASRLLRVVPAAQAEGSLYRVQQLTQRPIRIIPIASARIRYSRLNTYSSKPTTIASLDFEVTPFTNFDVILEKTDLALFNGQVESLTTGSGIEPPVTCRPRDDTTFVYKLTPEYGMDIAPSPSPSPATTAAVYVLDISLGAVICISETCRPRICMQWRTNVDFSMPLNPTFGGPSQVLQRNNRPASLPMTPSQNGGGSIPPPTPGGSVGAPATHKRRSSYLAPDIGVTISFSGPSSVEVGKPFYWDVFIVNRGQKQRKFAMAAVPRRKRTDARKHIARPSSSSLASRREEDVAEAVTDENIVYAMQKNAIPYETELVCLSTDVRVGPLLPGTCHSTELKLLPLATGSLHVEAVRLVDLNSNETMDVRDLPDIVAYDRQSYVS